jgi:diacylglycerol kinase family enzyme
LKICCLLNNKSGSANHSSESEISGYFESHGLTPVFLNPREDEDFSSLAAKAVKENYDIIVAGGGDGTINAVAGAIIEHKSIKFGVLPMGTLNHFARDIGIPFDLQKAVEIIALGHTEKMDVATMNDQVFLNNSSVGLYPAMVKLREGLQHSGYRKWPAAFFASVRIFSRFRKFQLELLPSQGAAVSRKTALLFVGNNAYETAASDFGKRATLNGGRLWVTMPISSTRWGLLMNLFSILIGRVDDKNRVTFETTELKVLSRKRQFKVALDGEVVQVEAPLVYRILPKALNVIVSPSKDEKT